MAMLIVEGETGRGGRVQGWNNKVVDQNWTDDIDYW